MSEGQVVTPFPGSTAPLADLERREVDGGSGAGRVEMQTYGHATLVVFEDGEPIIATDPWLVGSVYWRSWWLEQYPTPAELDAIGQARFVYITHSHPDHLNPPTLRRLGKPRTLHPQFPHYEVPDYLRESGYEATLLSPFRWYSVTEHVSIMSVPTFLDDSMLVVDTPNAVIINANDTNPSGQLLELLREHLPHRKHRIVLKSYSPASSAVATYRNGVRAPLRTKADYVQKAQQIARALGATHYVPFASQAFFSREDSRWANEHKVRYADLLEHWNDPDITLCPPFPRLDLTTGTASPTRPADAPVSADDQRAKVVEREEEEAAFVLPADFPERLAAYCRDIPFLRMVLRHGIGFHLTTSGSEWHYNVWTKRVEPALPSKTDVVITLPDKVLYEALVNGILCDLGITMLIRVDTRVDVRLAYAAFSLMTLRDYRYARGLTSVARCALYFAPYVFPKYVPNKFAARMQEEATDLPASRGEPKPA